MQILKSMYQRQKEIFASSRSEFEQRTIVCPSSKNTSQVFGQRSNQEAKFLSGKERSFQVLQPQDDFAPAESRF
eukprot:scaffold44333_cov30-Attheya_sp.AAC.1